MFSESHPYIRRVIRFLLLPYCYVKLVPWADCSRSRWGVALDFFHIFFRLKDYPDNYGPCRLWERPRAEWAFYYGSNYNPYQRQRLRDEVQPASFDHFYQDKDVCHTLCEGMGIPVPQRLGMLESNDDIPAVLDRILTTSGHSRVIIKPVGGHAGLGIVLAERSGEKIVIRQKDRLTTANDFVLQSRSIVQEVLIQDPEMAEIAPNSVNTLRLMTMLTRTSEVITIGGSMRFGVGSSFVDNWSAGGIAVGVDHERGTLMGVGYDKRGNRYERHPISQVHFSDFPIPKWRQAEEFGHLVQRSLPFVKILGMDLAFTSGGVVLIEINSDADFVFQEQTSGPLLRSYRTWKAFEDYGLLYNADQRKLYDEQ